MKKRLILSTLLFAAFSFQIKAQTITTFAGGAVVTYGGDGSAATAAFLNQPSGVATDGSGNLYIADQWNNRVRKMTPAGIISTIAGNGTAVYGGDGGPATDAGISAPNSLAVDAGGNVYVSDGDNRIRKVNTSGIITTVAGNGTPAYTGDGLTATAASLNAPAGIAFDATGNMYIADMNNHCIRKVNTAGTISTMAGTGTLGFSGDGGPATAATLNSPGGVAADATGNIYIADRDNNRIRMVASTGAISTFAGDGTGFGFGDGGPATAASIGQPTNLCIYGGSIYIASLSNDRIRKIDPAYIISTPAGANRGGNGYAGDGGPATAALLNGPLAVAFSSSGDMYIADQLNNRIRQVNTAGTINTAAGTIYTGDGGPATAATLYSNNMCIDAAGNIFITDNTNNMIHKIDVAGIFTTIAGRFSPGFSGDGGPATDAQLYLPGGITCDGAGNIYFADIVNSRVRKINTAGIITTVAGGVPGYYSGDGGPATNAAIGTGYVAVDNSGNLYLSESTLSMTRVRKVDVAGIITTFAGNGIMGYSGDGGPATDAQLGSTGAIATDAAGNVYVEDGDKHLIRKINSAGIISTFAGNGTNGYSGDGGPATAAEMMFPQGMCMDNAGNLVIADDENNVLRSVSNTGIITTVAGNGGPGNTGDGGPATAAQIGYPFAVSTDATGNLYVLDGYSVIRKISTSPTLKTMNVSKNNSVLIPNPACKEFTLSSQNTINSILMIDAAGRLVLSHNYAAKTAVVNIAQLQSGNYTIIINGNEIQRLVKE